MTDEFMVPVVPSTLCLGVVTLFMFGEAPFWVTGVPRPAGKTGLSIEAVFSTMLPATPEQAQPLTDGAVWKARTRSFWVPSTIWAGRHSHRPQRRLTW